MPRLTITAESSPDSNLSFSTVSSPTESFVSQVEGGFPLEGEPPARVVPGTQVTARDGAEGVGLSDPQHASARRRMLDVINALHLTGYAFYKRYLNTWSTVDTLRSVQVDIDLPVIAVTGSQSAGKSSLIESISGITLPRASGTCTRFAQDFALVYSGYSLNVLIDPRPSVVSPIRRSLGSALLLSESSQIKTEGRLANQSTSNLEIPYMTRPRSRTVSDAPSVLS